MHIAIDKTNRSHSDSVKHHSNIVYYLFASLGACLIFVGTWWAYPEIITGLQALPHYANLSWAHNAVLVEKLLAMSGMIWLLASCFFWGGWLINRSYRKIRGREWRIHIDEKGRIAALFPPVLRYLQLSCYYLGVILIFVVLQYPLQFILFTH
ncbi:MAG: hypothetical protein OEX07_09190 [Gammaproteobacteria bacterium]|nr:hypothetical protein [Gammaproteobacteria bacterium]